MNTFFLKNVKEFSSSCNYNVLSAQVSCDQTGLFKMIDFLNYKVPLNIPFELVKATRGLIVALMAYERYLAVCLPFEYESVLSDGKRRIIGYLLTSYYMIFLFVYSLEYVLLEVRFQSQNSYFYFSGSKFYFHFSTLRCTNCAKGAKTRK